MNCKQTDGRLPRRAQPNVHARPQIRIAELQRRLVWKAFERDPASNSEPGRLAVQKLTGASVTLRATRAAGTVLYNNLVPRGVKHAPRRSGGLNFLERHDVRVEIVDIGAQGGVFGLCPRPAPGRAILSKMLDVPGGQPKRRLDCLRGRRRRTPRQHQRKNKVSKHSPFPSFAPLASGAALAQSTMLAAERRHKATYPSTSANLDAAMRYARPLPRASPLLDRPSCPRHGANHPRLAPTWSKNVLAAHSRRLPRSQASRRKIQHLPAFKFARFGRLKLQSCAAELAAPHPGACSNGLRIMMAGMAPCLPQNLGAIICSRKSACKKIAPRQPSGT